VEVTAIYEQAKQQPERQASMSFNETVEFTVAVAA